MNRREMRIICATLCVFAFLFLIVNSQKQTKTVPKNQINLKQLPKGGKTSNGNKKRVIKNNNNKVKVGKNKVKIKNNNKNKVTGFLSLKNNSFVYKSQKVFISGVNILYKSLAGDFGNGRYAPLKSQYEAWLKEISDSGGNAVRILINGNASITPALDSTGYSTGEDTASLIQELSQFLDTAQTYNIFVFISIWSGALPMTADKLDIFRNDAKLDRYIEKVLKPLVSGLSTKKALAAWEVINSPQGSVMSSIVDSNPCFDTQDLFHQMATFAGNNLTMKDMLRFINKQLDAIKIADPKALRSLVAKEEESSMLCDWCYNYWQNMCLIAAGGRPNGILDYYSFDAVAFAGYDYAWSPVKKKRSDYKLGKAILIAMSAGNCSASGIFNNAYAWGYAGVFGWRYAPGLVNICADTPVQCDAAMTSIKNNAMIKISI